MTDLNDLPDNLKIVSDEEYSNAQQIRILEFFKGMVINSESQLMLLAGINKKIKELKGEKDNNR